MATSTVRRCVISSLKSAVAGQPLLLSTSRTAAPRLLALGSWPTTKQSSTFKPIDNILARDNERLNNADAARRSSSIPLLKSQATADGDRSVTVAWSDGSSCSFPFIFLRDNCQCSSCYDHSSQQRQLETMFEVDMNSIAPVKVEARQDVLAVEWNDGHSSAYPSSWLHRRRFPKLLENIKPFGINYPLNVWGSELNGTIPTFDFPRLFRDDSVLLQWLETLATRGLAILSNAKTEQGEIHELKSLFGGYTRTTNYGENFVVKSKPNPSNLAYTVGNLLLHVDLPFYEYQPGIQLLHFVKHKVAYGGENHLVDGFNVANQLKEEKPEMFDLLTKVNFVFYDIGRDEFGDFDLEYERPAIGMDRFGKLEYVAMNNHVRGSYINAPTETVQRAYEALYALYDIAYRPGNLVTNKCEEGDILTFNNRRVMHGRAAYNPDSTGQRLLEGCYFDWDEAYSVMRRIKRRLGHVV